MVETCSGQPVTSRIFIASHTEQLTVSRSHSLWSEQDPDMWLQATLQAFTKLQP
ncbi:hypothetical protein GT12_004748 [Salmonella enterica subsp. enterica]|nr:hypothetical protein [Salmonella enterica subsp. enterica]EED3335094.1 hypothetical protein [Salmonella enterica subsp. enterica]